MPIGLDPGSRPGCLVLMSGGIESTVLLHWAIRQGESVTALFLHYGQRPATREYQAASAQCAELGLAPETLDISTAVQTFHTGQERQYHIPLPHRNLVALSLALSLAEKRTLDRVLTGITREDGEHSASASPAFLDAFQETARTLGDVAVAAPFRELSKAEVIGTGVRLGVDFAKTYSCLLGYPEPCGRCPQCRNRRTAFARAGRAEPQFFLARPEG
ncbi:7-cyano-7-deazaguanine synthase [Thiohalorhabdus sp. Cl-TMA]|uniref:7-cyano-7-deazaguanine synthase n=1 Tax=Thiohalorhabdus methylotrophus TaxID=3242694 RepID=A0ABV4TX41_9GAMM